MENVLRQAPKLILGLYDKLCKEHLAAIKVSNMRYHRMRRVMIAVYKILRRDNQSLCNLFTINESKTRGHNFFKVQTTVHKYFFSISSCECSIFRQLQIIFVLIKSRNKQKIIHTQGSNYFFRIVSWKTKWKNFIVWVSRERPERLGPRDKIFWNCACCRFLKNAIPNVNYGN